MAAAAEASAPEETQEDATARRLVRRQLATWANTMVQVVGLERLAEELMGRRKWGSLQEVMMVGQDWRPPPTAECPHTTNHHLLCSTPTPSQCHHNTIGVGGGHWAETCDSGGSSGSSSPARMGSGGGGPLVVPHWYLKPPPEVASPSSPADQPLDLSSKPASHQQAPSPPGPSTLIHPQQPIKVPSPNKHIFKAKPRLTGAAAVAAGGVAARRTYTEDELQAALRDIQSGKLGTRRAAVIYGIPRSTLRNKVYKLSQERRDVDSASKDEDDDDDLSGAEEEREVEKMMMKPLLSMDDLVRLAGDRSIPRLRHLLGLVGHEGAEIFQTLPQELVKGIMSEERLVDSGVILKIPSYRPGKNEAGAGGSGAASAGPSPGSESPPGPAKSEPPPQEHPHQIKPVTILNRTLPLDFRREAQPLPVIRNHNNNHLEERKASPGKTAAPPASGGNATGGKGTRPKRGKYRNYDRDSLVEAVRAVQRGEMSVHRAGSYYGVPHSTLEYKVKERHLMRPRKREPKPQGQQQQHSEEAAKRKDEADKRVGPAAAQQRAPFPQQVLRQPNNGLKLHPLLDPAAPAPGAAPPPLVYPAPFPFWPSAGLGHLPGVDYARPEMFSPARTLHRHREEKSALGKTTREIAESLYDGSGENGSFLDGIIRSSLETGLPASAAAAEGGKALLEQLCRGQGPLSTGAERAQPPPRSPSPPPRRSAPEGEVGAEGGGEGPGAASPPAGRQDADLPPPSPGTATVATSTSPHTCGPPPPADPLLHHGVQQQQGC